jgi:hypothetical protein
MAHILLHEENPNILSGLLDETVKLDIVAGVPALGRSLDLQNLVSAAQDAAVIVPAFTQLSKGVDAEKLFKLVMAHSNVPIDDFMKSKEQMRQEAEAEAQVQEGQNQMMNAAAGAETAEALQSMNPPA